MFIKSIDTNKYTIYNRDGKRKGRIKMRQFMQKEIIRNLAGIILLYLVIIVGVLVINARMEQINENDIKLIFTN